MCCCCPPAITALFYLWVRSGFSKDSVAGALTFFPPDPPLYRFIRIGSDGETLPDDSSEDESDEEEGDESIAQEEEELRNLAYIDDDDDDSFVGHAEGESKDNAASALVGEEDKIVRKFNEGSKKRDGNTKRYNASSSSSSSSSKKFSKKEESNDDRQDDTKRKKPQSRSEDESPITTDTTQNSSSPAPTNTDNNTTSSSKNKEKKNKKDKKKQEQQNQSPAKALTERARKLRKRAKRRNKRDANDAANKVTYIFQPDPRLTTPPAPTGVVEAIKVGPQKKTGTYIAALVYHVPSLQLTSETKTILYSHGNATDIGAMNILQAILCRALDVNVVMYDYSGYGESGGIPMEQNTYRDIKLMYGHTVKHVAQNKEENVIIYGQSVGSGPSCYLCSKRTNVGGLILHSPFTSGMRVLTPSRALACLDIFPNIDRIQKVQCPVMIIHGARDEEVDIAHGMALHEAVRPDLRREPWWVRDRGHNDITDGPGKMTEYIRRLREFLISLD